MDLNLTGLRAIVTGGSRGIGHAIVEELAAERCAVEYCARTLPSKIHSAASKVKTPRGIAVDLEDRAATQAWLEQAIDRLGGLDLLVLNASAMAAGNSRKAWSRNYDLEIAGLTTLMAVAEHHLRHAAEHRGDAAVVIIGSTSAYSTRKRDAYGATKAALAHVAKGLSHELAPSGVRVNMVSPGPTYSVDGIWQQIESRDPAYVQKKIEAIPLGRMGTPAEIANVVVFLCSPRARFVVGANVIVDGGRSEHV